MAAIQRLSEGDFSASSQIPFGDATNGQDRRASVSQLTALLQEQLTAANDLTSQYSSPAASGFNVTVSPIQEGGGVFLLLTPLAGYAAGTVTLPQVATCEHGQQVVVHTTQAVTTLTIVGSGATSVSGAPTTMAAGGFFRLVFDAVQASWYRIG